MAELSPENRVRRGALLVSLSGALTFVLFAAMLIYAGSNPKPFTHPNKAGFNQALLWLELAADRAEVDLILGPAGDPRGRAIRAALDRTNYVDFAFMIGYSALNACLIILVHLLCRKVGRGLLASTNMLNLGLLLSLIMYLGDVGETIQLLILTGPPESIGANTILYLNITTRIKWAALFLSSLLLGAGYAAYFRFSAGLLIALVFSICGMLGFMSISIQAARALLEIASLLLGLGWFLGLAHAIALLIRKPATP